MTTEDVRRAIGYLESLGAQDIDHPGGTLLGHLRRVADTLRGWQARPALVLAGLCHAAYGTDGFGTALLPVTARADLAAVIGPEAEQLVYLYAAADRAAAYAAPAEPASPFRDRFTETAYEPTLRQRCDFAELTAANELDVIAHNTRLRERISADLWGLLQQMHPLLSQHAWNATKTALAH